MGEGQVHASKPSSEEVGEMHDQATVEQESQRAARVAAVGEGLKDALDDLLDEVDTVLEENAEDFVKAYIQKGGE